MNICLGVISVVLCTFFGYRLSVKYTQRKKFYSDFYNFNEKMVTEVSFSQKTLLKIVSEEKDGGEFCEYLVSKIEDGKNPPLSYITAEERIFLNDYINGLGKTDKATQLNFLKSSEAFIKNKSDAATKEEEKYKKLYIKLGFMFGLIIFIALI